MDEFKELPAALKRSSRYVATSKLRCVGNRLTVQAAILMGKHVACKDASEEAVAFWKVDANMFGANSRQKCMAGAASTSQGMALAG
jgi:hypothetical protein